MKAARRVDGARAAIEQHGCDVIVLDDAYQHVRLARDRNICLIDATNRKRYLSPRIPAAIDSPRARNGLY